jgi:hypothetical protein
MRLISKSKYLSGLQCRKLFWTQILKPKEIPPADAATQAIFDQGHEVGHLAKSIFPGGVEIEDDPWKFSDLRAQTREAMKERVSLYEAAFGGRNAFARADILVPVADGAWDIVEVKSGTEVKPVNIHDLALQRYAAESDGLNIGRCFLMHVNNKYVKRGAIEAEKLFAREDVTGAVAEEYKNVESNLEKMLDVLRLADAPDVPIGPHCDDPFTCALHDVCWAFLPKDNPLRIAGLPKTEAFRLIHEGKKRIVEIGEADIPKSVLKKANALKFGIQIEAAKTGRPALKAAKIGGFLKKLAYPRYYLDFETFQSAVPIFDETRPYQQVPFQFSLHIVPSAGAAAGHFSYLAEGKIDPRPEFLALLRDRLGEAGSIICYNAAFERGIVDAAVKVFPAFEEWWKKTEKRFVDLLEPFRSFAYYHPGQLGSASLKAVLPALTGGPGYEDLEICEGGQAAWEYRRITFGMGVEPAERARIRALLEQYCGLDTEGMIRVVAALEALELPVEVLPKKVKTGKMPRV